MYKDIHLISFLIAKVKLAHLWRLRNNRKGFMNREWKSLAFWHIGFQYDNVLHILLCNLTFLRQPCTLDSFIQITQTQLPNNTY